MSKAGPQEATHGASLAKYRGKRPVNRRKFFWLSLAALVVAGIAWFGFTAVSALGRITDSSDSQSPILKFIGEQLDPNALKGEGDGRINVLLIGIGGSGHKGGALADTIMVASVDPENKKLALLSIPRDLRVPIAGNGTGKINSAHSYGESQEAGTGPQVLKETVSTVLDLPIHYYVRADFDGFVKLIDTIGGVTIDVPKPLNDPLYPDDQLIGYEPLYIKQGVQEMSGKTALKYARSRQTTSDFDRAQRQQQILVAFRDEALSANVLTNPKKLTDMLNILGDHIRTDMSVSELQRLFGIVKDVNSGNVISKVLDNDADGPLKSVNEGGYYLVPKAGDFSEVRRIAYELFTDPYLVKENARIEILNATGTVGRAGELELDLKSLGYNIVSIDRTDEQAETVLYDYTDGKMPFTVRFLEERLGAKVTKATRPTDAQDVDLRLVIGSSYKPMELRP